MDMPLADKTRFPFFRETELCRVDSPRVLTLVATTRFSRAMEWCRVDS
jgi:hypothetical protein